MHCKTRSNNRRSCCSLTHTAPGPVRLAVTAPAVRLGAWRPPPVPPALAVDTAPRVVPPRTPRLAESVAVLAVAVSEWEAAVGTRRPLR